MIFSLINNAELLENKDLENLEPFKINAIFRMAAECMLCNLLDSDIPDTKSMSKLLSWDTTGMLLANLGSNHASKGGHCE